MHIEFHSKGAVGMRHVFKAKKLGKIRVLMVAFIIVLVTGVAISLLGNSLIRLELSLSFLSRKIVRVEPHAFFSVVAPSEFEDDDMPTGYADLWSRK